MEVIKTPIIPDKQIFAKIKNQPHELDYKAICVFAALGFFLDDDTYWLDTKVLKPATINTIDDNGFLISSEKWFHWHYTPRTISLEAAESEFSVLFEKIIKEQTEGKNVILPLSGGLDSRTQAVALSKLNSKVKSYSYSFENGYKESHISKRIANSLEFPFTKLTIKKEYLWSKINRLGKINGCYSEFTHPRQMAVIDEIKELGDVFSLGHWGDVLFDSDEVNFSSDEELLVILKKKIIKKGGLELANKLWSYWNLPECFDSYLNKRILKLWNQISIKNNSAKMRAFKSLYWAPRWTSVNLSIFESEHPITLPYYDNRMCKFICTIPENMLANRQIQIEYIKKRMPKLANITWQEKKPFNLYNYHLQKSLYDLPYRIVSKLKREFQRLAGKKYMQRNWELQFLGEENQKLLKKHIFNEKFNKSFISKKIISDFYNKFKDSDDVFYSHPVSMILTLSLFYNINLVDE